MKKINLLVLITTFALSFCSCSTTVIDEVVITGPITYTADVSAIISNNCLPCHAGTAPSAGLNLETYERVQNSTENGNLLDLINKTMPKSGLMAIELRETIKEWATQGYLKN